MLLEVNILAPGERTIVFLPKHVTDLWLPDHLVIARSGHYPASGGRIPSRSPLIYLHHHDPAGSVSIDIDFLTI